jgi:hypothetical protein
MWAVAPKEKKMFLRKVDFQRTTRRYVPEDSTLHNQLCENLKSYTVRILRKKNSDITSLFL